MEDFFSLYAKDYAPASGKQFELEEAPCPYRFCSTEEEHNALLHAQLVDDGKVLVAADGLAFMPHEDVKKIYIRSHYTALLAKIETYLQDKDQRPKVMVTGTPGVGKSMFAPIVLRHIMAKSRFERIALQIYAAPKSTRFYSFQRQDGVWKHCHHRGFRPELVISDVSYEGEPPFAVPGIRNVLIASPRVSSSLLSVVGLSLTIHFTSVFAQG